MKPIALAFSDLHLSDKPYLCRVEEPDWMGYQRNLLFTILSYGELYDCPIIFAGDFFNKPKVSPELLNICLRAFQNKPAAFYAIPGQHDLAEHRFEAVRETSFGSLVESGSVIMSPFVDIKGHKIAFVPYGETLMKGIQPDIVVFHDLVLKDPLNDQPRNLNTFRKKYPFAKLLISGDNHQGFYVPGKTSILNCGSSLRKTADQQNYQPMIYAIFPDLRVKEIPLDISKEKFTIQHIKKNQKTFIDRVESDGVSEIDYPVNLKKYMDTVKTKTGIRSKVMGALNESC